MYICSFANYNENYATANLTNSFVFSINSQRNRAFTCSKNSDTDITAVVGYGVKGGVVDAVCTSGLRFHFATYVRIELSDLGIPEGEEVIVDILPGFMYEKQNKYPDSLGRPNTEVLEYMRFKMPKIAGAVLPTTISHSIDSTRLKTAKNIAFGGAFDPFMKVGLRRPGELVAFDAIDFDVNNDTRIRFGTTNLSAETNTPSWRGVKNIIPVSADLSVEATQSPVSGVFVFAPLLNSTSLLTANTNYQATVSLNATASSNINAVGSDNIFEIEFTFLANGNYTVNLTPVLDLNTEYNNAVPNLLGTNVVPSNTEFHTPIETNDLFVDWGDGTILTTNDPTQLTHTFNITNTTFPNYQKRTIRVSAFYEHLGYIETNGTQNNLHGRIKRFPNTEVTGKKLQTIQLLNNPTFDLREIPTSIPSSVTNLDYLFSVYGDPANQLNSPTPSDDFDRPELANWDTSEVTSMVRTFMGYSDAVGPISQREGNNFNIDISAWDVRQVRDMSEMFRGATAFNQPIGSWEIEFLEKANGMFRDARNFDQDLSSWRFYFVGSYVRDLDFMFHESGMSQENMDRTLIGWANHIVNNGGLGDGAVLGLPNDYVPGPTVRPGINGGYFDRATDAVQYLQNLKNWQFRAQLGNNQYANVTY